MKRLKGTRCFNGKRFVLERSHRTKAKAQRTAKQIRAGGDMARITQQSSGLYSVWARGRG